MKNNLREAPLFLLVEADPNETAEALFRSIAELFDPRHEDHEWGPLYQIGPKYLCEERIFFQVQTFAGSLGTRMMLAIGKGELQRAILFCPSGESEMGFERIQPNGEKKPIAKSLLIRI